MECTVCGQCVKLSEYTRHQAIHLGKVTLSSNGLSVVNIHKCFPSNNAKTKILRRLFKCESRGKKFSTRPTKEQHELTHVTTETLDRSLRVTTVTRSADAISKEKKEFRVLELPVRVRKRAPKSKPLLFQCLFCVRRFATQGECRKHENDPDDCSKPSPCSENNLLMPEDISMMDIHDDRSENEIRTHEENENETMAQEE